jgi:hypothetical protein
MNAKPRFGLILSAVLLGFGAQGFSATRYVDVNSPNPSPPYTNWATAARVIQDAVDAAAAGDEVVATNGIYATGGRATSGSGRSRVVVDKPLTLRSVNGAQFTHIDGLGAVRCVYLTNSATLVGLTLTNGFATNSGGVWCWAKAVVSDCVLVSNVASDSGGGVVGGTLSNCLLAANSAGEFGGGACNATLNNCRLTGNTAAGGGGTYGGTLNNCTLTGNTAQEGGGAASSTLNNCALTGNLASDAGGGAIEGTLNNCTLTGNTAQEGGGASSSTLNNCIASFNFAASADANYDLSSTLNYCCTSPLPGTGAGNIATDPELASPTHLSLFSPCRGAGCAAYATGADIDGEPWANPPSMGCDEYHAGSATGSLSVRLTVNSTNVAVGFPVALTALIQGRTTLSVWDFGDRAEKLNQPFTTHAWVNPGCYEVSLWGFNRTYPDGVSATVVVHVVSQPVYYVAAGNPHPVPPCTSWATAATNIQDAVDAATLPGALVLVTNGTYATGGRPAGTNTLTNRVAVEKPLVLRSVNGPQVTIIQGYQPLGISTNGASAVRCVYLAEGASLSGFTLTNGAATGAYGSPGFGGGVWCVSSTAVISNCVLAGNSATYGGGAYGGTLINCTLVGNSATYDGGGAVWTTLSNCILTGNSATYDGGGATFSALNNCALIGNSASNGGGVAGGTLNNCTLTENSAGLGGGVAGLVGLGPSYLCRLNNCILYFNTANFGANYYADEDPEPLVTLSYCCTTPMPTNGVGNITNAPLFVDAAAGDLHLQPNSPCINAGNNAYAPTGPDLDGSPRVVGGNVDMGAHEFQHPASALSYAWLQQYGLPTDGSADFADPDRDGLNNWQEWRCGTDPTNALSALRLLSAVPTGSNVAVTWQSVAGVNYFLERSTNLTAPASFKPVAADISGQPGTTVCQDTDAPGQGPFFYRVGVR